MLLNEIEHWLPRASLQHEVYNMISSNITRYNDSLKPYLREVLTGNKKNYFVIQ